MNAKQKTSPDPRMRMVNALLLAGGIFVTWKVGRKLLKQINKDSQQLQVDDSPAVRQAMTLRSALNPSGISWLKSSDGTNELLILDTAKTITNIDEVEKAYQGLYDANLLDDLQSDLSGDDYQKFLTLISSNKSKNGGKPATQFAKSSNLIVAIKEVYLRSSPDASNHGAIYEIGSKNNIVRKANAGEFLGYATGKQHFDEKNNVKFIEVGFIINGEKAPKEKKAQHKKKTIYWVSSATTYVAIFTNYNEMFKAFPITKNATPWMKPLDFFNTVDKTIKGIHLPRVIARGNVAVLDDRFQTIARVEDGTLLGQLIMTIHTGKNNYHQFLTIDNTRRWVLDHNIQLQSQ